MDLNLVRGKEGKKNASFVEQTILTLVSDTQEHFQYDFPTHFTKYSLILGTSLFPPVAVGLTSTVAVTGLSVDIMLYVYIYIYIYISV